jgi:uncharacterized membrane protein YbhN (UPF0104 family)
LGTLDSAVDSLARVDARLILVALVFHLANFALRSAAWRNVLRAAYPDRDVALLTVAGAYAAGVAINSFTPARGGDVAKIALVRSRLTGSSVATIAASMGVVSLFDGLVAAVAIAGLAASGSLPSPPGLPHLPSLTGLVVGHPFAAAAAAAVLAVLAFAFGRRCAPRIWRFWVDLRAGTVILATPRRYAAQVVPLQLGAWGCRIAAAYFLLGAFGVPAGLAPAVIVVVVGGLSTLLPTPGGMGTQQLFLAYFLQATASTATLVAFSVGMQATVTTVNLSIGVAATMVMLRTLTPLRALRGHIQSTVARS